MSKAIQKVRGTPFKLGNPGKPKGALSEKTRFWLELKDFITTEGAEKFQDELMKLDGKEYINSYINILEYFQPKLQKIDADVKSMDKTITIIEG
jgi:hypothetical protein